MTKYVIRRIAQAIPVLFGISIAVYAILLAAPGGPTGKFAQNPRMTLEQKEAFKRAWGLDQPIYIQCGRFLANIASGDLGISFKYSDPVISVIGERLPATDFWAVVRRKTYGATETIFLQRKESLNA